MKDSFSILGKKKKFVSFYFLLENEMKNSSLFSFFNSTRKRFAQLVFTLLCTFAIARLCSVRNSLWFFIFVRSEIFVAQTLQFSQSGRRLRPTAFALLIENRACHMQSSVMLFISPIAKNVKREDGYIKFISLAFLLSSYKEVQSKFYKKFSMLGFTSATAPISRLFLKIKC